MTDQETSTAKDGSKKEKKSKHHKEVHKSSSSSKHTGKHKKEKKHSKKHHKEKKDLKKDKKLTEGENKKKSSNDDGRRGIVAEPISIDHYFLKSLEFRVWLKQHRQRYFEDLSTEEAKELFEKGFVSEFNSGRLPAMYYSGEIPIEVRQSANKSQHRWGIRLDTRDKEKLREIAEDVDYDTKTQKPN